MYFRQMEQKRTIQDFVDVFMFFRTAVCVFVPPTNPESQPKVTLKVSYKTGVQPLNSSFFREPFSFLNYLSPKNPKAPAILCKAV